MTPRFLIQPIAATLHFAAIAPPAAFAQFMETALSAGLRVLGTS